MREGFKTFFRSLSAGLTMQNPVLFEAIGLAPVAAMAVSLKSAIILAVVSCVELLFIELFACLALKRVKSHFRVLLYAVLGVLLNIPVFLLFERIAPNETQNAGIFVPLLAVNSLIVLHCERFAVKNTLAATAADAVSAGVGYAAVSLLVGVLREVLGSGTLYSRDLGLPVQLPGFLYPFGGLLLLGFLAAVVQACARSRKPDEPVAQAFDMREVSESHVGSLRSLLHTEFDPYGEADAAQPPQADREKREKRPPRADKAKRKKPAKKTQKPARSAKPPEDAGERALRRAARAAQADYAAEFDEILSELDRYRETYEKAPSETAAEPDAPETAAEPGAQATGDAPEAADGSKEKGGDEA